MEQKKFEELLLQDDFMFGVIMRIPKYCKTFLETILGIQIARVEYPEDQKTIDMTAKSKSVRLDYSDKIIIPIFKSTNLNHSVTAYF